MRPPGRADIRRTAYGAAQFSIRMSDRLAPSGSPSGWLRDIVSDVSTHHIGEPGGIRTHDQGIKSPTLPHANRTLINCYGPPACVSFRIPSPLTSRLAVN